MNDDFDETSEPELTADEEALLEEMPRREGHGRARDGRHPGGHADSSSLDG